MDPGKCAGGIGFAFGRFWLRSTDANADANTDANSSQTNTNANPS